MELNLDIQTITSVVEGNLSNSHNDGQILKNIITDSRSALINEETLFICLTGPRHNGHDYIESVLKKGCKNIIVSSPNNSANNVNFIQVRNTTQSLQKLAKHKRNSINYPLLAITGSNGKTITKEWLSEILSTKIKIYKSPKSYNSQVGVAFSLLGLDSSSDLGLIEAGISKTDEMSLLMSLITPRFGLITNIGTAHAAGFASIENKIEEKISLFKQCDTIFYCSDHTLIQTAIKKHYPKTNCITWGKSEKATLQILSITKSEASTIVSFKYSNETHDVNIPFTDNASIENILHCISISLYFKIPFLTLSRKIKELKPLSMRLVAEEAIHNCSLIDDSYSNDLESLKIALDFQSQQNRGLDKSICLSDFIDIGHNSNAFYKEVSRILKQHHLKTIYLIGPEFKKHKSLFSSNDIHFFETTSQFIENIASLGFKNESILVKGSRPFKFERIVKSLRYKKNETRLDINLQALEENLNYLKSKLKPKTKVMAMVKAYSYGAGSYEIAQFLSYNRADYLAVAYLDEGIKLRTQHIDAPIMVMNVHDNYHSLIEHNLEPEIFSLDQLQELKAAIGNNVIGIHLKLDVGMHRLGFTEEETSTVCGFLIQNKNITVKSIFSHLPCADIPEQDQVTNEQIKSFEKRAVFIERKLGISVIKHILNSAGAQRFSSSCLDMVRLGIGLYGIGASKEDQIHLTPVASLRTAVSSIRPVKKGEAIGYGGKGKLLNDGKIATIAIGYADGFNRRFSNGIGEVLINNKLYPVIGNVCMDMTMIDIGQDSIQEGDEVIVFNKELPIYQLAEKIGTIPYELLTNISERVKRTYSYE